MPIEMTENSSRNATSRPHDLTGLLQNWSCGDPKDQDDLFARLYPELKKVAARQLRRNSNPWSCHASELVNEVYLRLDQQSRIDWQCREQFFAVAATFARRILIDRARSRARIKRGGDAIHLPLEIAQPKAAGFNQDLMALKKALAELAEIDPIMARIVDLRFFAGKTVGETAQALGLSKATAVRRWRFAKAWLAERLATSV